jgi:hypothetical protein
MSARFGEYLETQALLKALEGDEEGLEKLVAELLPNERRRLDNACMRVSKAVERVNDHEERSSQ